ncbi:hypothetical protein [Gordonia sp. QH-12]|uniref:hypothetical protein n=1 Tax=Gordonia sp. QH-12 TaxID=1437876 RepID=UPI0012E8DF37|nr:hypothetical protein [Gordonia sp. QH-12]
MNFDEAVISALRSNLRAAADVVERDGVGVSAALRSTSTIGVDHYANRVVLGRNGFGTEWRHDQKRTSDELAAVLRTVEPTIDDVEALAGTSWREAAELVLAVASLDGNQLEAMDGDRSMFWDRACSNAYALGEQAQLPLAVSVRPPWCAWRGAAVAVLLTPLMSLSGSVFRDWDRLVLTAPASQMGLVS